MTTTYVLFVTACGCSKMVPAEKNWVPPPYIDLTLDFPVKAVDWLGEMKPPETVSKRRRFRLEREEIVEDDFLSVQKKIFTFIETDGP